MFTFLSINERINLMYISFNEYYIKYVASGLITKLIAHKKKKQFYSDTLMVDTLNSNTVNYFRTQ